MQSESEFVSECVPDDIYIEVITVVGWLRQMNNGHGIYKILKLTALRNMTVSATQLPSDHRCYHVPSIQIQASCNVNNVSLAFFFLHICRPGV